MSIGGGPGPPWPPLVPALQKAVTQLIIDFGCIFIFLSQESNQCAIRARLGVARHMSTTPRWGIPLSAFPNGTTGKLFGLFSTLSL